MIQLDNDVYAKLKKDADDNKQIVTIIRWIILFIVFLFIFMSWGKPIIDLDIRRKENELRCQMAIVNAENNVKVRQIESEGMDLDDYIRWLEAKEKD